MLDIKHKNIGATVSMLNLIYGVLKTDKLDTPLTELFMAESNDCDHKVISERDGGVCIFNGSLETNLRCCIGECPLGRLVNEEIKGMNITDIQSKMDATYIGPCVHCGRDVTSDNLAHVDDDMQMCKPCFNEKEVGSS